MNMLQALTLVRNCSLLSHQMRTRQGVSALKTIDRKIQSLMRKKAWRDSGGAIPIHMASPDFAYVIPEGEQVIALRAAEGQLQFWLEHARQGDMASCAVGTMDVLTQIRAVLPQKQLQEATK